MVTTSFNATQITPPRVPIIDDRTGLVSREWYRYFYSLYAFTGGGTGILPIPSGGTGLGTLPTNGQLLIGDTASSSYKLHVIDTGAGIAITNGSGTILITNTGVLSNIAGSGIAVSNATGNVTVSNTGVLSAIAGSGISVSNATGNVTFANTGVLSFSGGSTGLLPSSATTGAVSLSGTLGVGYGGTGQTTYTNGQLLIGNTTGNTLTKTTLTAGSGVSISNGAGSITISATGSGGTVTSVSVVSANGLAGTVANSTTTPAITLSTTVTGLVKGNGTTLSAASAATDYVAPSAYASANGLTMSTARLLGRTTASTGAAEEISVAGGLTLSAGVLTGVSGTVTSVTGTAPVVSSGGTTPAISMPKATTSVDGYLSSTDWTTFNNKGSGTVTSVTATSPVASTGGATPVISMPAATTSVNGYLTSTDWTTFNNKGSGTVTSVTGTAPVVSSGGATPAISMAAATTSVSGYLTSTDWTTFNNKGSGTVTSVGGTGTVNGITLTGTVTSSGNLTLGGTLSGVSLTTQVSGVLPVANGGTNASTASITSFNNITGYTASGATGTTSTNLVFSTSPTLVTPTLGAALATSIKFGSGTVLSSYEEGSWTPGVAFGGGTTGILYLVQAGKYVKVGTLVTVIARLILISIGVSTGSATFTGLPYTTGGGGAQYGAGGTFTYHSGMTGAAAGTIFNMQGQISSTSIALVQGNANVGWSGMSQGNFTNTAEILFSFTYTSA